MGRDTEKGMCPQTKHCYLIIGFLHPGRNGVTPLMAAAVQLLLTFTLHPC